MILPGSTLGVMGGGQLGRMFCEAARALGYHTVTLDPDPDCPAGQVADWHICGEYDDQQALSRLGGECAAITIEFENVPAESMDYLTRHCLVSPGAEAVRICRDRILEKSFLRDNRLPTAPFAAVTCADELPDAIRMVGTPALLKTATGGYDGKGQQTIHDASQAGAAFRELGERPCVLERRVELELELSVVVARSRQGEACCFPVAENRHSNGILDTSIVPARTSLALAEQASSLATRVAAALDYTGVLAVEFFVVDGELLINEIAPRPHNSGHYTLNAAVTSQFEQQVRMLCDLPAGDTRLLSPVVMVNLLGDLWGDSMPSWEHLLQQPEARLYLYGKSEARPGRKMGHFNLLHQDIDHALQIARTIHRQLKPGPLPQADVNAPFNQR